MSARKICREFANSGTCNFKNCRFAHVRGAYSPATKKKERNPKPIDLSNSEREFQTWRENIPLDLANHRPLRARLASFFQEARRLIDVDVTARQDVIQSFAREGGLARIKELVEQDFESMSTIKREDAFRTQMLPFLEIVSHPNVVSSLILEQPVGTIYNFLYGYNGERATNLLKYICDVVAAANNDEDRASQFEVSVHVFSKIVDLNSTALVQESLKAQAKRFEGIFLTLSTETVDMYHNARSHLERLLRRLDIGSSLPSVAEKKPKAATSSVSFVIHQDPPGGRHDNDHPDICHIMVMPTSQEISCNRTEYLPSYDPAQWHVQGVDGLLDRNFRLLREDTIGQLRDAIYHETNRSNDPQRQKPQQRIHVYRDSQIVKLSFDQLTGFYFEVGFPQLPALKGQSAKDREDWWRMSKRLQSGALVCLVIKRRLVLFCTVIEPSRSVSQKGGEQAKAQPKPDGLWKESTSASVLLELTDSKRRNIQPILDQYSSDAPSFTLVEFPGVLLPAFEPTLRALQSMKQAGSLPFSDLLISTSGHVDVPFPQYAMKPGFSFDLSCVMDNGANLSIRPGQPVDLQYLQQHSSLDDAQAAALVNSLQRRVGLIQGPPGTGKSYTGVALIRVLLANKQRGKTNLGPIICVTYTNHALDQLLEALVDQNLTSQIVRIGSQSKSEKLERFNLRNIARGAEVTRMEKRRKWELHQQLERYEEKFEAIGLKKHVSDSQLLGYLRQQYPKHFHQLFGKDKDDFETAGAENSKKMIYRWLHTGPQSNGNIRSLERLEEASVHEMSRGERTALFNHWSADIKAGLHERVTRLASSHSREKPQLDDIRDEVRLRCLNEADIIGLTTTGLARNLNMLRRLQSKVVLCEEAGEVLEPHLLAALLPSVEHAILIGDHLQLRPQVQNYELSRENRGGGERYSLDVSLFERLVESESAMGSALPFSTLETQRRMHPSIAQLVRDTLYPQLDDTPSTAQYPEVVGMRNRLFWLDHRKFENGASDTDAMSTSHWNEYEVDMTVALVNHLVRQGEYSSGDIAVVTPYLGQLYRLRQKFSQFFAITLGERDQDELEKAGLEDGDASKPTIRATLLQTLRVATIDNFQGEEAKVVVISLVRSNPQNRCGFLRTPNRINVLLSRAQHGMYIIGDSQTSIHVKMWADVVDILQQNGNFGTALQLQCPRHPNTPIYVSEPDDFPRASPEGGCDQRCVNRLPCGHACVQKCHSEMLHNTTYCLEACPRPRKGCTHPCPKRCGDRCPDKCIVNVFQKDRTLECGHLKPNLPCWQNQDLSTVRCTTLVKREVPGCQHNVTEPCFIDVTSRKYSCIKQCRKPLLCGHTCMNTCSKCVTKLDFGDVQTKHGECRQQCGRKHSTCAHVCTTPCHGDKPCPSCQAPCDVSCGHSKCMRQCSEPCAPCAEAKCFSACPHSTCTLPCAAPCDHIPCSRRCESLLDCGHRCPSLCGERCPSRHYCQICGDEDVKNHEVDFILGQPYKEINLDQNPCIFPKCGHFLTRESMDAQMDLKKYYDVDAEERPVAITDAVHPFSLEDIKACATCRGPLRDIARYGRLVRRAILDESTKKLILYLNQEYVPLAQEVPRQIALLQDAKNEARPMWPGGFQINGTRTQQVNKMVKIMNAVAPGRWKKVLETRKQVNGYCHRVDVNEQPFNRVRDLVWYARQRNKSTSEFQFDEDVLQMKGVLQGATLSLRLDLALLADLLTLKQQTSSGVAVELHLSKMKEDCQTVIDTAHKTNRFLQQAEGYIFLAQLHALERSHSPSPELAEAHLRHCRVAVTKARFLCTAHPGQTRGLLDEVESVEKMLAGQTFYTAVTNNERMVVIQAMAREFRGTGHWYYCRNGHPFTIGECGGAVQMATCPECNAPVGGRGHQTADGVTRAGDLENGFSSMNLAG